MLIKFLNTCSLFSGIRNSCSWTRQQNITTQVSCLACLHMRMYMTQKRNAQKSFVMTLLSSLSLLLHAATHTHTHTSECKQRQQQ